MKIDYISSDGIHPSEKEAIEKMRLTFNATEFSQSWQGYAGFMMMDTTYRDREIDLVLLTHDRLLIIELKKWRGKIEPMQDHWLKDGNDMGRSPVLVMADKWKILSSKIQARLPSPAKSVWIDYRIVMCGSADYSEISADEKAYILSLDQFLRIAKPTTYRQIFGDTKGGKPNQQIQIFTQFFRGKDFKPAGFSFNNFQIIGDTTFSHPDGLYKEYKSIKKDDQRHEALLRRWDFAALAGQADTVDERARIALREHQVLGFIHEQNEELDNVVLQPLSHPTRDDIDADFCELYRLPSRQVRLSDFVNRFGPELSIQERTALVKVLISHVADLHDIGVAHRDVSDHSIWLEQPTKVSLSGFITAYFPESGTVGGLRDRLRAGKAILPEDSEIGAGEASDPFRRDVYLLGIVAHHLLYLTPPKQESGLYVWNIPTTDPYEGNLNVWLSRSLELIPSDRFSNAREMLNSFNGIQFLPHPVLILDMRSFEAFRTDVIPMVVYPIQENIKQGHSHVYKSNIGGMAISVKVWYGKKPDPKRPEETHELQNFLEKSRLIKSQRCSSLPEIVDFGLSDAGAFLVQRWIDGISLSSITGGEVSAIDALTYCQKLIKATTHLHGLGFQHGDLHPENVMFENKDIRFIDAIDILPGDGSAPHSPAYVPVNQESTPIDQRDCFAVAKMCSQILDRVVDWGVYDPIEIRREIHLCMNYELKVYALDRIEDAIVVVLTPPKNASINSIMVQVARFSSKSKLMPDNGAFHIGVYAEDTKGNRREPCIVISVSGVRKRLLINLKPDELEFVRLGIQELQHSQFVHAANKSVASFYSDIELTPAGADNVDGLIEALRDIQAIRDAISLVRMKILILEEEQEPDEPPFDPAVTRPAPATESIWKSILDAEEATLPEVEIVGVVDREFGRRGKIRIPYTNEGSALDYDSDAKVEALQEINGELVRVGEVDIRETTSAILVLDNPIIRIALGLGDKIKLRSQQDLSSFRRRYLAVNRILNRESVIPDLIDYFDPLRCPAPTELELPPTDEALDVYSRFDEDGKKTFSLNSQQRLAFQRLWSNGPVSLLQGPPGTGKTSFIASFIHYALSQGAKSILLASQSHEAVNNAAEKVIELCRHTELPLDVVRFGAEGMVSEQLRPYHSSSILRSYRDMFRSEMRERVGSLSRNLGLSNEFVDDWFDLDFYLGRMFREIDRLSIKQIDFDLTSKEYKALAAKLGQRTERFHRLASEKFEFSERMSPADVVQRLRDRIMKDHSVRSFDAVARLDKVIAMAQEWIDRLGVLRGNFEEFLAKTRSLVCGTCVGLGRSQFGVSSNRYDWVIVDEAARATPGELAVAVQSGRRVLLVGDHRQLPPLYTQPLVHKIVSDLAWDDRSVLIRSDFERAFESSYGHQVGATLRTQYRMSPPIGELVSKCFYPIPLEPGRGNSKSWFSELPERAKSIVTWVDTSDAGRESFEKKRDRIHIDNQFEAREILDLLRSICATTSFIRALVEDSTEDEKPIGVICMYADQKRLLLKLMSEQDWATGFRHLIKIDTVDSYQGKENRIIIVSATRNNPQFDQGFVSSPERANVAISRAMDRLIIVGAAKMWREKNRDSPMGTILAHIELNRDGLNFDIVNASGVVRRVA
ncbi:MAG: AAA domain-containing protein [bacterium]|nr:AAA domain-containing protein [bacterium]